VADAYIGLTGSGVNLHFCAGEFAAGQVDEIEKGFRAWNAGSGLRMRGADWTFTRDSDYSIGDCSLNGTQNEVWDENSSWFAARGWGAYAAYTRINGFVATKIVFDEDVNWVLDHPQNIQSGQSMAETAMHEMGHAVGFGHEFTYGAMSVMNYTDVDMARGKYRLREDDYVGLATKKSHSSAGKNLMLSRWTMLFNVETQEAWSPPGSNPSFPCVEPSAFNSTANLSRPGFLHAVIHGTTSVSNVLIEWRASPDKTCFTGPGSYIIGSRTPTLSVNDEYGITTPSGGLDFSGVPPGDYYICAMVDPYDVVSETAENDNSIVSAIPITVKSDGFGCDP
jgi:hypothetical protein